MARASSSPLSVAVKDGVARLRLNRPDKRNAVNDALIAAIDQFFAAPPEDAQVAILEGEGPHFCAGLDLAEHKARTPIAVVHHSASWHAAFRKIQYGRLPVVALLKGAVIGGGLELALSCHVRVAEPSAFFQLPEGKRGIFVGGGATVRVARVLGADRMAEMMLTGRKLDATEGTRLGLAHYLVEEGAGDARVSELASDIKGNAPVTNFLILNALARIADMPAEGGLFTESLAAAIAQTAPEAQKGLAAFLERKKK